ncbi:hypothetical protein FKM82_021476 [Ascaphus truei]
METTLCKQSRGYVPLPVPTCFLLVCVDVTGPVIVKIVMCSLQTGIFPDPLKEAVIRPPLKKSYIRPGLHGQLQARIKPSITFFRKGDSGCNPTGNPSIKSIKQ